MYITSLQDLCNAMLPELVQAYYQLNPANTSINAISEANPRKQELIAKSVDVGNLVIAEQFLTIEDRLVRAPVRAILKGMVAIAALSATLTEAVASLVQGVNELPVLNQDMAKKVMELQTELFAVQHLRENMVKSRNDIEQYRLRSKQMGIDLLVDVAPIDNAVAELGEQQANLHMKLYRSLFRLGIRA